MNHCFFRDSVSSVLGRVCVRLAVSRNDFGGLGYRPMSVIKSLVKTTRFTGLSLLLVLAACGTTEIQPTIVVDAPVTEKVSQPLREDLVAKDLIYVLRQLAHPATTTVQVPTEQDTFLKFLLSELIVEGYGIQQVQADQGANFLQYRREADAVGNVLENTYTLTVGDIELQRSYEIRKGGSLFPVSAMTLAGSRIAAKIDRSLFKHLGQTTVAVDNIKYTSVEEADDSIPTISLITSDVVSGVTERAIGAPSVQALNSGKLEVGNLFFGDASNFASVLDGRERQSRDIVPFGDDQLRMGNLGKRMVLVILNEFDERTDLISVVGCSNGPTMSELGNEGLALGRAARVTEEFMSHGVARDRILDEGCWAPQSVGDRFPSRGVVVEVWRREAP